MNRWRVEESMRPRLQSGAGGRPLNSSLEVTSGRFGVAKSRERLRLTTWGHELWLTWSSCRRLRLTHQGARAAGIDFDRSRGARPSGFGELTDRACGDARQARARVIRPRGARLTSELCRLT